MELTLNQQMQVVYFQLSHQKGHLVYRKWTDLISVIKINC